MELEIGDRSATYSWLNAHILDAKATLVPDNGADTWLLAKCDLMHSEIAAVTKKSTTSGSHIRSLVTAPSTLGAFYLPVRGRLQALDICSGWWVIGAAGVSHVSHPKRGRASPTTESPSG
jgi:hypothetical protein